MAKNNDDSLENFVMFLRKLNLNSWVDCGGKYPRLVIEATNFIKTEKELYETIMYAAIKVTEEKMNYGLN